jgi:hypothetical protein
MTQSKNGGPQNSQFPFDQSMNSATPAQPLQGQAISPQEAPAQYPFWPFQQAQNASAIGVPQTVNIQVINQNQQYHPQQNLLMQQPVLVQHQAGKQPQYQLVNLPVGNPMNLIQPVGPGQLVQIPSG